MKTCPFKIKKIKNYLDNGRMNWNYVGDVCDICNVPCVDVGEDKCPIMRK